MFSQALQLALLLLTSSFALAQEEEVSSGSAECTSSLGFYDLKLHVIAIFLLLVSSSIGVFLPLILGQRAGSSTKIENIFFGLKHFGNGIIMATAFIHLLFEGFDMFADPCMGNKLEFEPVAPAITMAGVVIVFIIDFSSTRSLLNAEGAKVTKDTPTFNVDFNTTSNDKKGLQKSGTASSDIELAAPAGVVRDLTVDENRKHWEVNMLEGGTVFHSFLVGLTIGAQGGQAFNATLAAIVFHQMFEGAGLGSRIAILRYLPGQAWKKWVMATVFAFTTSVGMALGIAIRNSVNLSGSSTLVAVGTMESLSGGILLYASIATLLVGDWLNGEMIHASNKRVAVGATFFAVGMAAMSFIGKFV